MSQTLASRPVTEVQVPRPATETQKPLDALFSPSAHTETADVVFSPQATTTELAAPAPAPVSVDRKESIAAPSVQLPGVPDGQQWQQQADQQQQPPAEAVAAAAADNASE